MDGKRGNRMTKFEELVQKNNIYLSAELSDFILSLERKYKIINSFDHYNSLVNFSQNKNIPVHEWFKYREGFSGALIDELINDSDLNKDDMVVDPFVGSGTTLVSAVSKGFDAIGVDVNPMSAAISKVKSSIYSDKEIDNALNYLSIIKKSYDAIEINDIEDISKYFPLNNYIGLKKIFNLLEKNKEKKVYDILFCAYLSIIEECSNRRRDGNGLKTVITKIDNVLELFEKKVLQIVEDVKTVSSKFKGKSYVFAGTSLNLSTFCDQVKEINKKKIGSIIFSPPYANSFDYFESYKLELWLGGFLRDSNINNYRSSAVRSFIGGEHENDSDHYVSQLADEIQKAIPLKEQETGKKDARTRKVPQMIKGYFKDMENVVCECYKSLRDGGKCYIVIDQSSYLGKIVPSDLLVAYSAEKIGFTVEKIIECRNAKTSAQQIRKYPYLKEILRESIIVLRK